MLVFIREGKKSKREGKGRQEKGSNITNMPVFIREGRKSKREGKAGRKGKKRRKRKGPAFIQILLETV